jgi:hypothetical protein
VIRLLLVVLLISISSIVLNLQAVSLSGPRFIVLTPDLLFRYARSSLTRHIQHWPDISDLRLDITDLLVLTGLNLVSFRFDCLFTPPLGNFQLVSESYSLEKSLTAWRGDVEDHGRG